MFLLSFDSQPQEPGQTSIDLSLCEYIWLLYQETTQRCYVQNVNDIWQHFVKVENFSESFGTLICLPRKVFTFENHFGRSSASSCQVNNVRGSSLLLGQVELFVFVPETFESELDTGFDLDLIQLVQYRNNIWLPWYHLAEGMKEVRRCFPLPLPPEYTEIQAGCTIRVEMLLFWKGGK